MDRCFGGRRQVRKGYAPNIEPLRFASGPVSHAWRINWGRDAHHSRQESAGGAAAGIGRAVALALAREGADLFLIDIDGENLEVVAEDARRDGVTVVTDICDLSQAPEISAAVKRLGAAWAGLDILINNAGLTYYGPTEAMTAEQWRQIMAVNLLAPIQLVHELLPLLAAAEEAHVVNVCSMFGVAPWRKAAAYQTSRYGLVGFTAALRAEFQREHFGITALCPGFVRTALLDGDANERAASAWISTTPEKVAAKAITAIRRSQGLVLITPAAHFYWLFRIAPGLVDWLLREGWRRRERLRA